MPSGPLGAGAQLAGYPAGGFGDRYVSVADHKGPASYAVIVPGTPPTGGDTVLASEFGLKFLSAVMAGMSDDGNYIVVASPTLQAQGEPSSFKLIWIVRNTGAEVAATTNLSARAVRLFAIGR